MKGMQIFIRKKAALLGIIMLILFTAGSAAACGGADQGTETGGEKQSGAGQETYTCQLSVKCDTALKSGKLDEGKRKILPSDGVILAETQVEFREGDSVYDILKRELKSRKIQMEAAESPMDKTQYIEGIANLYELDCGELSGWMYKVNDTFQTIGCSKYKAEQGDRIEWLYSCDRGKDVGEGDSQ